MYALIQNNTFIKTIQDNESFNIGEQIYSSKFITDSNEQGLKSLGIYQVSETTRPDDRFYWVDGPKYQFDSNEQKVLMYYDKTNKQLEDVDGTTGLKSNWKKTINETSNSLLKQTDWMIIRKIERNIDVPTNVTTYRQSVIDESNRLTNLLDNVTTVEDLIDIVQNQNWPVN